MACADAVNPPKKMLFYLYHNKVTQNVAVSFIRIQFHCCIYICHKRIDITLNDTK